MPSVTLPAGVGVVPITPGEAAMLYSGLLTLPAGTGAVPVLGGEATLVVGGPLILNAGTGAVPITAGNASFVLTVDPVTALEDAIFHWVRTGTGFDADHVIWGGVRAGGPMPAGPYVSMRLLGLQTVSGDWLIPRREGSAIVYHIRGTRHPTLELTLRGAPGYGSQRAELALSRVLAAVHLPSVGAKLRTGGVGVGRRGPIRTLPGMRSMMFDPVATVEIGLHIGVDIAEVGSAIEHVTIETPGPLTSTVDQT